MYGQRSRNGVGRIGPRTSSSSGSPLAATNGRAVFPAWPCGCFRQSDSANWPTSSASWSASNRNGRRTNSVSSFIYKLRVGEPLFYQL